MQGVFDLLCQLCKDCVSCISPIIRVKIRALLGVKVCSGNQNQPELDGKGPQSCILFVPGSVGCFFPTLLTI